MRGLPAWLAWGLRLWRGAEVDVSRQRTLAEALMAIDDPQLRAVLGARWGDYGSPPQTAPLLEHALVTGAYDGGAYYPVGGPVRFVQTMQPVIEQPGGEVRLGADVKQIVLTHGRASAASSSNSTAAPHTEQGTHVISAMGVTNTVACLMHKSRRPGTRPCTPCARGCPTLPCTWA